MIGRVVATVTVPFVVAPEPIPMPACGRILRVARLLALGHQIERSARAGEADDLASAARA